MDKKILVSLKRFRFILVFALILCFSNKTKASVDYISSTNPLTELQNAISIGAADTIMFNFSGSLDLSTYGSKININRTVVIMGVAPIHLRFNGAGAINHAFDVNTPGKVELVGITFENFTDGAVVTINGDLIIRDCVFKNNSIATSGAAIRHETSQGTVSVYSSTFEGNTAQGNGGAILSNTELLVANCTFFNNQAVSGDGGAIFINPVGVGTPLIAHNTLIQNNAVTGGAIDLQSILNADIFNNLFHSNTSGSVGSDINAGLAVASRGFNYFDDNQVPANLAGFVASGQDVIGGGGGSDVPPTPIQDGLGRIHFPIRNGNGVLVDVGNGGTVIGMDNKDGRGLPRIMQGTPGGSLDDDIGAIEYSRFTVKNNGDSGFESLREILTDLNGAPTVQAPFVIVFDIEGAVSPIDLTSELPQINKEVTIAGYSQDMSRAPGMEDLLALGGYVPAVLPIELRTSSAVTKGLHFAAGSENSKLVALSFQNFSESAVRIETNDVSVAACIIGLDGTDYSDMPNGIGIYLDGASTCKIGSQLFIDRNVISANDNSSGINGAGILIDNFASGNEISGNFIGTHPNGISAIGNENGIRISGTSSGNFIGEAIKARHSYNGNSFWYSGNVISGNFVDNALNSGVVLDGGSSDNTLQGNFIGVNAFGNAGTTGGNNQNGVLIQNSAGSNYIGFPTSPLHRNIISGNILKGINFSATADGNLVRNNYIGTDVTGLGMVPNLQEGIIVLDNGGSYAGLQIGGCLSNESNIISGNTGIGLNVLGSGALVDPITIMSNEIGVASNGTNALPNNGGVSIAGAFMEIGNSTANCGNVISGNNFNGLMFAAGANEINVRGNKIGVDGASSALGNATNGIYVQNGCTRINIGGLVAGEGNEIAHNGNDGVSLANAATTFDIDINANSIHDNAAEGIDLADDNVSVNDLNDADTGPNYKQNYPEIRSVLSQCGGTGNTLVEIYTDFETSKNYAFQYFISDGAGEGETYIIELTETVAFSGQTFIHDLGMVLTPGDKIVATASQISFGKYSTSEFSLEATVLDGTLTVNALVTSALTTCNTPDGEIGITATPSLVPLSIYNISYDYSPDLSFFSPLGSGSDTTIASGVLEINDLSPGYYTNFQVNIAGCNYLDADTLYIAPAGSAPTIAGSSTACVGETGVSYGVSAYPSINWFVTSGSLSTVNSPNTSSTTVDFGAGPNIDTLIVQVQDAGTLCYLEDSLIITVAAEDPTFTLGSDFCMDNSFPTPVVTGTTGGTFTIDGGGTINATTGAIDLIATTPGINNVTYTTPNCGATSVINVTIYNLPTQTVSKTDVTCNGWGDGTIAITPSGGIGPYQYSIDNGVTFVAGASFSGLIPGNYDVVVLDGNGCESTSTTITIIEPLALSVNGSISAAISCNGDVDGALTCAPIGGTVAVDYIYSWSHGPGTQSVSGLAAGSYTVTITDDNGCTNNEVLTLTNPTAITMSAGGTANICLGSNVVLGGSASGGTGTLTFGWTPSATLINETTLSPTATPLTTGISTYTLTVTDQNLCVVNDNVDVNVGALPVVTAAATDITCNGFADGTITVTPSGGTGPYMFSIDNGVTFQAGSFFGGLTDGNYDVVVQDANGCVSTSINATIIEPTTIFPFAGSDASVCDGNSTALSGSGSGGTGTLTYLWTGTATFSDPNISSPTATPVSTATLTMTVTDDNGCFQSDDVIITVYSMPIADAPTDVTACGSYTLPALSVGNYFSGAGGTGTAYFAGNSIASTMTMYVYAETGTVPNCTDENSFLITINSNPVITGESDICFGTPLSLMPNTGGNWTSSDAFVATIGVTSGVITTVGPGTVDFTFTNGSGCAVTSSTMTVFAQPEAGNPLVTDVSCFGDFTGSIDILPFGAYTHSWSGPSGFSAVSEDITGLEAGSYTNIMTDINGCVGTYNGTVIQPASPLSMSVVTVNPSCSGDANGSITFSAAGGTGSLQYSINGGSTYTPSNFFAGLIAGSYNCQVLDGNGCVVSSVETLVDPNPIVVNGSVLAAVSCFGGTNGSVTCAPTGGTVSGGYNYYWDNGVYVATNLGLGAGTYTVTVEDDNLCTTNAPVTLLNPPLLTVSLGTDVAICAGASHLLNAAGSGGTGAIVYTWDNGLPAGQTNLVSPSDTTTYNVTVTDDNLCTATHSMTVAVNSIPAFTINSTNPATCGGNGSIDFGNLTGGATYSLVHSTGSFTSITAAGTGNVSFPAPEGTYTSLVLTDDGTGCTAIAADQTLTDPNSLSIDAGNDQTVCEGTLLVLGGAPTATGTTGSETYSWDTGVTPFDFTSNPSVSPVSTTKYYLTVVDGGCSKLDSITITVNPLPMPTLSGNTSVCENSTEVYTAAGSGAFAWTINNGTGTGSSSSGETIDWGLFGTLTRVIVELTDVNSCVGKDTLDVTVNQVPDASVFNAFITHESCFGLSDGEISYGGGPATTWFIDGVPSSNIMSGLPPATYEVVYQDVNGCRDTLSHTINAALPLIYSAGANNASCNTASDGIAFVPLPSISGGMPDYFVDWFSDDTYGVNILSVADTLSGVLPGMQYFTITDGNFCVKQDSVEIGFNTIPLPQLAYTVADSCVNTNSFVFSEIGGLSISAYTWTSSNAIFTPNSFDPNPTVIFNSTGLQNVILTYMDAAGCTATDSIQIEVVDTTSFNALPGDISCFGLTDGQINVSALSGGSLYQYILNGGTPTGTGTSHSFTGLTGGSYTVEVINEFGCSGSAQFLGVAEPAQLVVNPGLDQNFCNGVPINLSASAIGGTGTIDYSWTPGGSLDDPLINNPVATPLVTTTYTVTVSDDNNCTHDSTITLTLVEPELTATSTDVSCFGAIDGNIIASTSSGGAPFTFSIDDGTGPSVQPTGTFVGLAAGTYTIEIADNGLCTNDTIITIVEPLQITGTLNFSDVSCFGLSDGIIDVNSPSGGDGGPYGYLVNSIGATLPLTGQIAGIYDVEILDGNGCSSGVLSDTIFEPTLLTAAFGSTHENCFNDGSGSLYVQNITGGTGTVTTDWQTNPGGASIGSSDSLTTVAPGNYVGIITDANGCMANGLVDINPGEVYIPLIDGFSSDSCINSNSFDFVDDNGAPLSGVQFRNWTFTNGSPATSAAASPTGVVFSNAGLNEVRYQVISNNGCVFADTIDIEIYDISTLSIATTNITCFGLTDGEINATAIGAPGPYQYSLNGSGLSTVSNWTGLAATSYTIDLVNGAGCMSSDVTSVVEPLEMTFDTTVVNATCGLPNGSVEVTNLIGGSGSYDISIAGQATNPVTNIGPNTYTIIVSDANALTCQVTGSAIVSSTGTLPATPQLTGTYDYCENDVLGVITATGTINSGSFAWYVNDTTGAAIATTGAPNVTLPTLPAGSNTLYVIHTISGCTSYAGSAPIDYTVIDYTIQREYEYCAGETVPVSGFAGLGNFNWTDLTGELSSTIIPNPIITPQSDTSSYYFEYVTGSCTYFDSISVILDLNCGGTLDEITNAFSPDGDGVNDTWVIDGIDQHPNNKVTVFNRWGDLVFELENYNNTTNNWSPDAGASLGANANGGATSFPSGTYFYIVELFDINESYSGWVQLTK